MPRKTTPPTDVETPETIEDKLDRVLGYLHRMERRDRARMIGSYIHSMIWLISILFVFWSTYYFIAKGPEIMNTMTKQIINQSMGREGGTTNGGTPDSYMKIIEDFMKGQQ